MFYRVKSKAYWQRRVVIRMRTRRPCPRSNTSRRVVLHRISGGVRRIHAFLRFDPKYNTTHYLLPPDHKERLASVLSNSIKAARLTDKRYTPGPCVGYFQPPSSSPNRIYNLRYPSPYILRNAEYLGCISESDFGRGGKKFPRPCKWLVRFSFAIRGETNLPLSEFCGRISMTRVSAIFQEMQERMLTDTPCMLLMS